mgnify:CR=1 FL=1
MLKSMLLALVCKPIKMDIIRILGGADIKTYPLDTSDTYSALSEEGFVYVNTGMDGLHPGTNDVKMYGNIGFLDKTMVSTRIHITMDLKFL